MPRDENEGVEAIPTRGGSGGDCPDCFHRAHFRTECHCGCEPGFVRKQQRDAEGAGAHNDPNRQTEGFY